jgi:hypothetical protein
LIFEKAGTSCYRFAAWLREIGQIRSKQLWQAGFEALSNLLDIHQRLAPHSAPDAAVIRPVQPDDPWTQARLH